MTAPLTPEKLARFRRTINVAPKASARSIDRRLGGAR